MTPLETLTPDADLQPTPQDEGLELAMQELEALEAPGFWTGFQTGVTISTAGVASYAAITVATT